MPHRNAVTSLAFSPDGATLATAGFDRAVRPWAVGPWHHLRSWKGPETFHGLAFALGGKALATGRGDGTLQLWDAATGQALRLLGRRSDRAFDLPFSPDGKTLAPASADHTVKLWDAASGRELRTLAEHTEWVYGVAFAPDGETLASCGQDGTVRLWEMRGRAEALADWLAQGPQPDNAAARVSRARACLALNQPDKAPAEAARAVELQPQGPAARRSRAEIYLRLKKSVEALADYTRLVALQPDGGGLRMLRGDLNARCGKWAEAAGDFGKAAGLNTSNPEAPWLPWCRQALAHLAAGNGQEHRKACARIVERFRDTEDWQTAFFTAWTCVLGPGAVPVFVPLLRLAEKAMAKDQHGPRPRQAVGAVLYRMGRPEEALPHFQAGKAADGWQGSASPACAALHKNAPSAGRNGLAQVPAALGL